MLKNSLSVSYTKDQKHFIRESLGLGLVRKLTKFIFSVFVVEHKTQKDNKESKQN